MYQIDIQYLIYRGHAYWIERKECNHEFELCTYMSLYADTT